LIIAITKQLVGLLKIKIAHNGDNWDTLSDGKSLRMLTMGFMGALRRLDGEVAFVHSIPVVAIIGQRSTSVLGNCDTLLRSTIEDQVRACRELSAERAAIPAEPVNPELVVGNSTAGCPVSPT
jgi:hypothetical protein